MKLIYKDLIKFLSKKPSIEILSEKLFQLGHEHEIISEIFDMELTPNRGDCLSIQGLARDLNIFFGKAEVIDIYNKDIDTLEIDFENLSPSDCPKISFLEIEVEDITETYRSYLDSYFSKLGNNKINFFTDISNYVSYELGQPTHCYDRELITDKLFFENKECNCIFKTLLGSEVMLSNQNCVFSMSGEIINLAGVMGGESTSCSSKTKKVLVECAYFNPESIIGKSIKYNLKSDAAHKFERGVDIASQEIALRRFIKVVEDHALIKSLKLKSYGLNNKQEICIPINTKKINKVLGTNLEESEYLAYLKDFGFNISNQIKVPTYRHDIETDNDLAEEIARAIGYNNIKNKPIKLNVAKDKQNDKLIKIESFLINNGFSEAINFPFTSKNVGESIKIDNPLDSNKSFFRTSLEESLLENLLYNERRQKDSIKLFEISDIYTKDSHIRKQKKLGIIISGRLGNNYKQFTKKLDFNFFNQLLNRNLDIEVFKIKEIQRHKLNSKKKDKIFYTEILIDDIPNEFYENINTNDKLINFKPYIPISEYPTSTRDFSFSITNLSLFNNVVDHMEAVSDPLIKFLFMFDFYKNEKTNTVKIGYRFIFQSLEKTLSEHEINNKIMQILKPILKLDGVSIPGMSLNNTKN